MKAVRALGLAANTAALKPGVRRKARGAEFGGKVRASDARGPGAWAAKLNFMGPDKPNVLYARKEVRQERNAPTVAALRRLERLVRYLYGKRVKKEKFRDFLPIF